MTSRYFECFPKINYNGWNCVDITRREKVLQSVMNNPMVFYPYDLQEGQRPDIIGYKYYNDSYYSWLVWLSNKTIDPVLDWYLDPDDFYKYIIQNYGSLDYTQRKILKWRTNWDSDYSIISPSAYAALGIGQVPYWTPKYDINFNVIGYTRSNTDIEVNTNLIVSIIPDSSSNTIPSSGDLVSFVLANNVVGSGEVISSNNTNIILNNINGYYTRLVQYSVNTSIIFNVNDTVIISNTSSNGQASVVSSNTIALILSYQGNLINGNSISITNQTTSASVNSSSVESVKLRSDFSNNSTNGSSISFSYSTVIANPIDADQVIYYEPVYLFDNLDEKNTEKQTIMLLDNGLAFQAYRDLQTQVKK